VCPKTFPNLKAKGANTVGKSQAEKTTENNQLLLQQQQMQQAQQAADTQRQLLAQQQAYAAQISPLAQSLMGFGSQSLNSLGQLQNGKIDQNLYNAILAPQKNAITSGYSQAQQNLVDALGSQGIYGSGLSVNPQATLQMNQVRDLSGAANNAYQQTYQQQFQNGQLGAQLGLQGANILQGQQGIFNPVPYGQLGNQSAGSVLSIDPRRYQNTGMGLLGSLAGAGLGVLGQTKTFKNL
jgi:hypothetical protein